MEENQTTNIASAQTTSAISAASLSLSKTLESVKPQIDKLIKSVNVLLMGLVEKLKALRTKANSSSTEVGYSERPSFTPNRKKKMLRIYVGVAVILVLVGAFLLGRISKGGTTANQSYADSRPLGPNIQAQEALNRDFSFPLLDDKGAKVSTIKYKITTVDLEDSIIVNGQKATAVKGRTFLVINLEITNNHTQGIQINSKDYIRLQVNGQGDWIAPDIHNDPVAVQAISTKITRLGFPINDTDKNLTLQIGEITGAKQLIKLNLERK